MLEGLHANDGRVDRLDCSSTNGTDWPAINRCSQEAIPISTQPLCGGRSWKAYYKKMERREAACEDRRQLQFREKEHLHQYCVSVARAVALQLSHSQQQPVSELIRW